MQISASTLNILKSYSQINAGIIIEENSNRLVTKDVKNGIWSTCVVEENFPTRIAISNLNQFLNAVDFFKEPSFSFDDKYITITSPDGMVIQYQQSVESVIEQDLKMVKSVSEYDATLHLSSSEISTILKACRTLGIDMIGLIYDGEKAQFVVKDLAMKSTSFSLPINNPDIKEGVTFTFFIRLGNFKIVSDYDYKVQVIMKDGKGRLDFSATNSPFEEYRAVIALEAQHSEISKN